jgi:calcineurin-like phosphoesterase family protein
VPVHYDSIGKSLANVHGHVHGRKGLGPRYFDVSVESINYTPISLEDLKVRVEKQITGLYRKIYDNSDKALASSNYFGSNV